jgi:hypothetical protein
MEGSNHIFKIILFRFFLKVKIKLPRPNKWFVAIRNSGREYQAEENYYFRELK